MHSTLKICDHNRQVFLLTCIQVVQPSEYVKPFCLENCKSFQSTAALLVVSVAWSVCKINLSLYSPTEQTFVALWAFLAEISFYGVEGLSIHPCWSSQAAQS